MLVLKIWEVMNGESVRVEYKTHMIYITQHSARETGKQ